MSRVLIAAFCSGALFGIFPSNVFDGDPGRLIMPFLGLFMAGIFPAISLTINSIKSGGRSVQKVREMISELRKLLTFLQFLFILALAAAIVLVIGEALQWGKGWPYEFYSSRTFNVLLGFIFGTLLFSLPKMRVIFSALLSMAGEIAEEEASDRFRRRANDLPKTMDRFPTKEKFGELFEPNSVKMTEISDEER